MSSKCIQLLLLLLLISCYDAFVLPKLPSCQCDCCPGEQCASQLLLFSVEKCDDSTCSFDQCYRMYPKKCGLIPGITNTTCIAVDNPITNASDIIINTPLFSTAAFNMIFPMTLIGNLLFCLVFSS